MVTEIFVRRNLSLEQLSRNNNQIKNTDCEKVMKFLEAMKRLYEENFVHKNCFETLRSKHRLRESDDYFSGDENFTRRKFFLE